MLPWSNSVPVYPRVCGGTWSVSIPAAGAGGLSPRVRGNLTDPASKAGGKGSIPACAGEPVRDNHCVGVGWVYPRVCGGTWILNRRCGILQGLSPRVRGNRDCASRLSTSAGSIPACAGEPHPRAVCMSTSAGSIPACAGEPHPRAACMRVTKVYPRVCGGTIPNSPM